MQVGRIGKHRYGPHLDPRDRLLRGDPHRPRPLAAIDGNATRHDVLGAEITEVGRRLAMRRAGSAWRGWFPVGGELTSGRPDQKEGIYFGLEHDDDHPLVVSGAALHGTNLFPKHPAELGDLVHEWMEAMRSVADAVLQAMAIGLHLPITWFEDNLTADPTVLFRIFHYPAQPSHDDEDWGVGEHTDYGLITLLAQDHHGGLQVRNPIDHAWIDVQPADGVLVCNLGDMLDRLSGGVYTSTPHRVRNVSGASRLSFPYLFDPSWDAMVPTLPAAGNTGGDHASPTSERWDGADVQAWSGTYGGYLTAKVANVFPELFGDL
jgi:isopenicillin N synthase-like dioxygenase